MNLKRTLGSTNDILSTFKTSIIKSHVSLKITIEAFIPRSIHLILNDACAEDKQFSGFRYQTNPLSQIFEPSTPAFALPLPKGKVVLGFTFSGIALFFCSVLC